MHRYVLYLSAVNSNSEIIINLVMITWSLQQVNIPRYVNPTKHYDYRYKVAVPQYRCNNKVNIW